MARIQCFLGLFLVIAIESVFGNDIRVLIVGAGSSGIAAASKLVQNGFTNVTLLEAEDRIGGRVNTIPFGDGFLDLGAEMCHGEKGNPAFELASPHGLLAPSIHSTENFQFAFANGQQVDPVVGLKQLNILLNITSLPELNTYTGGVGDFIAKSYVDILSSLYNTNSTETLDPMIQEGFLKYYRNFIMESTAMDDWNDDNGPGFNAYAECEGNQLWSWKGKGYVTILKLLMKTLPDPSQSLHLEDRMLLSSAVKTIHWDHRPASSSPILVETVDGRQIEADRVIFTPSLGVLKEQHHTLFNPQLTGKRMDAINGLSMGTIAKIFFRFTDAFWPAGWSGIHILWTNELLEKLTADNRWLGNVVGFLAVDGQPAVLCAWLGGWESVKRMEQLEEHVVMAELIELLKASVPHLNVGQTIEMKRTQWQSNPHFRGTYSFRGINATLLNVSPLDLQKPLKNSIGETVIQFAGEATHVNHYSTVHGAIETGWREAQRLIDEFK